MLHALDRDTVWRCFLALCAAAVVTAFVLVLVDLYLCGRGAKPTPTCHRRVARGLRWTAAGVPMLYALIVVVDAVLAAVAAYRGY